jgi:hypothetical protein
MLGSMKWWLALIREICLLEMMMSEKARSGQANFDLLRKCSGDD